MITGYYCTNIFSEHAKELIEFYREILERPFIKTNVDDSNGVYLGFNENIHYLHMGLQFIRRTTDWLSILCISNKKS